MIAILAYGSLNEDPGVELKPLIKSRIRVDKTPFNIEFARTSGTRNGAPTVVPVENMGASVSATLLVLDPSITVSAARDLVWRRELRKEGSGQSYSHESNPKSNKLIVEELSHFQGVETVLYTKFLPNLDVLTGEKLASLAVKSALSESVRLYNDGISYLANIKNRGVMTPLMPEYEASILSQTNTSNLKEAVELCRSQWKNSLHSGE